MPKQLRFRNPAIAIGVPLGSALSASEAWAQRGTAGPQFWDWHPMWGMWGFGMGIMMLIFWGAVIIGIVALIRWLWSQGTGSSQTSTRDESPLDTAKRRYAAGEISREEFEQIKRDLA